MSRPLRIELAGAFYHVTNHSRGRQRLFNGPAFFEAFLMTLEESHQRFGLEIHAYCLMENHYHLIVRTQQTDLSRCMRHINGLYTQRYNSLRRSSGPLFSGRFKAILIEEDAYLLQLGCYIHRRPIDRSSSLVQELTYYPWSSYPAYIGVMESQRWLYRKFTYQLLKLRPHHAQYRKYIELGVDEEVKRFYARKHLPPIFGTETFKEKMLSKRWLNTTPNKLRSKIYEPPNIERILDSIASFYGISRSKLVCGGRGKPNEPRVIAMHLCQEVGDVPLKTIATKFGIKSTSSISHLISSLKRRAIDDIELAKTLKQHIDRLARHTVSDR